MSDRVTFKVNSAPDVVDEIVFRSTDVHIEQMNKGCYWMRFGERVFWAQAHKGGQLTIREERP